MGGGAILLVFALVYSTALLSLVATVRIQRKPVPVIVNRVPRNLQRVAGRWYAPLILMLLMPLWLFAMSVWLIVFLPVFAWKAATVVAQEDAAAKSSLASVRLG